MRTSFSLDNRHKLLVYFWFGSTSGLVQRPLSSSSTGRKAVPVGSSIAGDKIISAKLFGLPAERRREKEDAKSSL